MKTPTMAAVYTPADSAVHVFALGVDNQIYENFFGGNNLSPGWQPLGGTFISPPAAVSDGASYQIFAVGVDNQMFRRIGAKGATWEALGGKFASPPVAVTRRNLLVDVFALGFDQQIYHKAFGVLFNPDWESLGGIFITPPAAVSWAPDRVDLFALGLGSQMFHRAWDGSQWLPWEALGGAFTSPPAAVSWGPNRLDVFALGLDNAMFHKAWDGSQWLPSVTDWEKLREQAFSSPPAAASWRVDRLDVFGVGPGNQMLWAFYDARFGWNPWQGLGEVLNSPPVAFAFPATQPFIDIYAFGANNQILRRFLSDEDFLIHPWQTLGGRFINP